MCLRLTFPCYYCWLSLVNRYHYELNVSLMVEDTCATNYENKSSCPKH